MRYSIDLPVMTEWRNVERLRSSVENCLVAVSGDPDAGDAVALVTAELAENAIKYGHWATDDATFRLHVSGDAKQARVVVENPIAPEAGAADSLLATLRWIEDFPSAEAAYQARLLEIAASAVQPAVVSRLGLVRLVYQAGCTLRAETDGHVMRVIADMPLSRDT